MITLIGKDLAKKGQEFVFLGSTDDCDDCRFKSSCVESLEINRKYIVKDVKDSELNCPIHDGGKVVPVDVELAPIQLLTSSKNIFEGSTFTYELPDCEEKCDFHDLCFPEGLHDKDKCIVLKNNGKHKQECKKGYHLNNLTLGFVI